MMPAIHPHVGGGAGKLHGADFRIVDRQLAYLDSAKILAGCLVDLLSDGAAEAKRICRESPPAMTKAQFIDYMRENCTHAQHDFTEE